MSVFNDFQRLWMQRFPQSSLSDAWEQDVRASLDRHKLKITELQKELEQETLYVEYLERLLSDVEKFRQSGGDPTTLFEAATTGSNPTTPQNLENEIFPDNGNEAHTSSNSTANAFNKSSLNLRESNESRDKNNRLSLNTDNKYAAGNNNQTSGTGGLSGSGGGSSVTSNISVLTAGTSIKKTTPQSSSSEEQSFEKEDKKDIGSEKDIVNRFGSGTASSLATERNGALHAQCITELAATITANQNNTEAQPHHIQNQLPKVIEESQNGLHRNIPRKSASTSHFVTVIEVKESKNDKEVGNSGVLDELEAENVDTISSTFTSFGNKATAPPLSPALTSPSMSASSYAAHLEAKNKKMPPRPPPKNIRRVEPPTIPGNLSSSPKRDSPFSGSVMPLPNNPTSASSDNSLERVIKPSDILRQNAAESFSVNRKTTSELTKFSNTPELMEELGRKVVNKVESLEKAKRSDINTSQSPTSSIGRTTNRSLSTNAPGASPTSILSKTNNKLLTSIDNNSTGSLDKKTRNCLQANDNNGTGTTTTEITRNDGSKESLASQHGISDIIKSYESVSSLSSDSVKAAQIADSEPYYDSVPLDNGADGEYVYIKPGRTGSSSSRDDLSTPGSTLPMGSTVRLCSQTSVTDPESPGRTNYANIDYFLQQNNEARSSSIDSDGEYDGQHLTRTISHDENGIQTPGVLRKSSGKARGDKIRSILNTIIKSETSYVECLYQMIQYKKAINANSKTSQPVLKDDEEQTIFYKIDELYNVHTGFLNDLKAIVAVEGGDVMIGDAFKRLAEMVAIYSAFLHNYGQAVETVKKCSANNPQFKKSVSEIVLCRQNSEQTTGNEETKTVSLEDLLHKPVARVQINALVFEDLINETPTNHPDHQPLKEAQKTIHMFLNQFNVVNQKLTAETNQKLYRMVKKSFIVESVDNHRKLRHLFLFNDAIACTKYKPSNADRIAYELKWFIPLKDVVIYEDLSDPKDTSFTNIVQLKSQYSALRDQLIKEEKEKNGVRSTDKFRRKLSEIESQLVLASPNLEFCIGNKTKRYLFYLSSEFERTQWIDSIINLQQTCTIPGANNVTAFNINALLLAMQKSMPPEMTSLLPKEANDKNLLVGNLNLTIQNLEGLKEPSDLYICLEVDSFGHYFRKGTTKMICRSSSPNWNEPFTLELESSQNLRILLYEAKERPKLKAKDVVKLNSSWLTENQQPLNIKFGNNLILYIKIGFIARGSANRGVPSSKPGVIFGAKLHMVLKREKRGIPFIISACIDEVERRGKGEVGIYRVSGSASDLQKLKKSFETNPYEAEQLLKDVDIHSVTGILKSYLRELPEALFTDALYPRFFETFNTFSNNNEVARANELLSIFEELPQPNKESINLILDHLIRVHEREADNKMSLHNLAMVFGPTLLRPSQQQAKQKDLLASSTVDVMAQAGILYCFLQARLKKS